MSRRLILSLLFCSTLLWAADPPAGYLSLFVDFAKPEGQIDAFPTEKISDNGAVISKNVDTERNGNLATRMGIPTFYTIAASSYSNEGRTQGGAALWVWVSTRSNTYFVQRVGGQINITSRNLNYSTPTVINLDGTERVDAVTSNDGSFLIAVGANSAGVNSNGWRLVEHGNNNIGVEALNVLGAAYLRLFLDRLLVSGQNLATVTGSKFYRISFSTPNTFTQFPAANTIDIVDLADGDQETGIGPPIFGNLLPIYSMRSIRILSATLLPNGAVPGNQSVRKISFNIGCLDQRTIKNKGNEQYFLSQGPDGTMPGIYSTNGISVKERSRAIRNFFKDRADVSTANYIPNAYLYRESYCLNISSKSGIGNVFTVCLDANDKATIYNNPISTDAVSYLAIDHVASDIRGNLYGISGDHINNENGRKIYQLNSGGADDNGMNINWEYKTKDFDMGLPSTIKKADRAYIRYQFSPTTFSVTATYDFGKSGSTQTSALGSQTVWTINSTTNYTSVAQKLQTVAYSSQTIVTKLIFPQGVEFVHINFDIQGSSYSSIDDIQFIAIKDVMK